MISENTPSVRIVNVWNSSPASVISANNVKVTVQTSTAPEILRLFSRTSSTEKPQISRGGACLHC